MKNKILVGLVVFFIINNAIAQVGEKEPTKPEETELWEPKVPVVKTNGIGAPPSDAIVLFDGENLNAWQHIEDKSPAEWILNGDGSMTVKDKSGDIETKQEFGSVQLHIEWRSNKNSTGSGQSKSNSGVWLQSKYEVQIVDSNDNPTYVNGQVGSVYKQSVPLAMASVPTGEWNSYDIIYHAPEFDSKGMKTKSATVTVLHNGVLIQDHFAILGTAQYIGWPKNPPHGKAPLRLQDHHDKSGVSFRNIWVRELD
ncbi:3-keto-disaccharide hydrolase [Urechidicola vernalis]|uniref:DUF1080 domain-containing protein n=1 Tax=Urechidicola vernalis TaxID=3075600 RepID=A0ABU2Y7H3_9FLAO|nr:DUF1080 domain-containing protein [Urechidicola sp. P050]MDT0553589.1 DUF1080 domain-containing protein [Urechidicola sp. P050]